MGDLFSYSIGDFIPYTRETYLQLLSATNELFWPWHLFLMVIIGVCVFAIISGKRQLACLLLAAGWLWVGWNFFHNYYRHVSWAGHYFAFACAAQGLCIVVMSQWSVNNPHQLSVLGRFTGYLLLATGVLWPLLSSLGRNGISQLEWAGMHPEPTAILTSGAVLLLFKGWRCGLLLVLPLVWMLLAALMLNVLKLTQYHLLFTVIGLLIIRALIGSSRSVKP